MPAFSFTTALAVLLATAFVTHSSIAQDTQGMGADNAALSERVASVEQWAYPPAMRGPKSVGLVRWNHSVRFAVIAQDGKDFALAKSVIADIIHQLPQSIQSQVSVDDHISTVKSDWYMDKAVIFVGPSPYAALETSLKPVLDSLSNEYSNNKELIANLVSSNPPSHTTFAIRRSGIIIGHLTLIRGDLPSGVKREGLVASVISAIGPSITLADAPGDQLFSSKNNELTPRALDFLRVMLSNYTEPGMSLDQFDSAAQRALSAD